MISAEELSVTGAIHDVPFLELFLVSQFCYSCEKWKNMTANLNVFEVGYMLEWVEERIERPA